MKKVLWLLCTLLLASVSSAQTKQTVAVYTTDASELNIASFVGDFVVNAIVKQGMYSAVERSASFRSQLASEHEFERSGEVDDRQIAELGKNFGAAYVCVVKIDIAMNKHFVTSRLINTTTSIVDAAARPIFFNSNDITSLEKSCEGIVESMLGRPDGASSISSSTYNMSKRPFTVKDVTFNMIQVQGGTFIMGDGYDDAKPTHSVTLSDYYIGETEVTQALWEAVMGNKPSRFKGADYPVNRVSWFDCQDFIRTLNALTGATFRLPTEAEWEYAARGGNKSAGYNYSGSNYIDDVAWYRGNYGSSITHPVAMAKANELEIYDMSGNVREWCSDWYGIDYYSRSDQVNPQGAFTGSKRVLRGGSWGHVASDCRVSDRDSQLPDDGDDYSGFRLVLVP